ncbi:unnamed protein product [Schistosoma margrebowiei]|uniref:purine-nucleoside phosphorylase n=1 Tax=Schistosoma margrebowiei TaxID=48269 RepID=A0A183LZR5_9TREM|nr:unnamed protein product [Schistosoma margrebowiei]
MAADYIKSVSNVLPDIGIICGSGLSKLVEGIEERKTIPYINIPNFPKTTVLGSLGGRKVVAMQGRFHMYEGYSNEEVSKRFGPRFPDLSNAYDRHLRQLALEIAQEYGFQDLVREGVYAFNGGPTYETPDESNMLLKLDCDVVGMSTVPEVIIACHCGIKVLAVSLIANNSILDAENDVSINHEKVLAVAAKRADLLQMWFKKIITRFSSD